jgi:radical SAM superfamily enzyme YgiQ (UPF0313 family)
MNVLLLSTYDLGRQPFGLASPAAWLRRDGADVSCIDLSREPLTDAHVREANLIGFFLPMHTATRLAVPVIERVRALNPSAHVCAYGLYAPLNVEMLQRAGVASIMGGEFEESLLGLSRRIAAREPMVGAPVHVSLARQQFVAPDRQDLPALSRYARLVMPDGERRVVGYTEASRGCKHLCRHCPIVPVYNGTFRVVQRDIVLEDIRRQVAAGAQHITFGDPDFFNGPRHAIEIVSALHQEFPDLTYDVTIKVEHILKERRLLDVLGNTGCAFLTSAVESLDDHVLGLIEKHHTRADFIEVVRLCNEAGVTLSPTFVAFHPWTTLESYEDFLRTLFALGLAPNVSPVQLAIRLLIPNGSRMLELDDVKRVITHFDPVALAHRWKHADSRIDVLQRAIEKMVAAAVKDRCDRTTIFMRAFEVLGAVNKCQLPAVQPGPPRATIPYLDEPWYC